MQHLYSLFASYFLSANKAYYYNARKNQWKIEIKYQLKICVYRFVYKKFNERLAILCKKNAKKKGLQKWILMEVFDFNLTPTCSFCVFHM